MLNRNMRDKIYNQLNIKKAYSYFQEQAFCLCMYLQKYYLFISASIASNLSPMFRL